MTRLQPIARRVDVRLGRELREVEGCMLSDGSLAYLLRAARLTVEARLRGDVLVAAHFADPPHEVTEQNARVFVTLEVGEKLRGCRARSGRHLLDTVIKSTLHTLADPRFGGPLRADELAALRVDLLFMLDAEPVRSRDLRGLAGEITLGVHGLKLRQGDGQASYKSTVPVEKNWSLEQTLTKLSEKAGLPANGWKKKKTRIWRYRTVHGREVVSSRFAPVHVERCVRGLPLVEQASVDRGAIEQAVVLGAEFTARMVHEDGRVAYTFDAVRGRRSFSTERVAALRSIAAMWALAEAGVRFQVPAWQDAARRAVARLLDDSYVTRKGHGLLRVGPNRVLNIGTAAFALLVLSSLDDPEFRAKERRGLMRTMLALEHTDGFIACSWPPEKADPNSSKQRFYAGQVLTALASEHARGRAPEFIDIAPRVFDFYRDLFARTERNSAMCAWLSKPFGYLHELTGHPRYSGFVLEMNDLLVGKQHGVDADPVDRIGSWTERGYSFTTGVYMESVAKGSQVARRARDRRLVRLDASLFLGARYLLQCQLGSTTARGKTTAKGVGGFLDHLASRKVRIDNQQHGLWALMEVLDTLELRYR